MKEYLIDLPGAEAFLREHVGANVQSIQELGRGEWSVAFAYHFDGHEYVARFGLFGDEDFMLTIRTWPVHCPPGVDSR